MLYDAQVREKGDIGHLQSLKRYVEEIMSENQVTLTEIKIELDKITKIVDRVDRIAMTFSNRRRYDGK